MREKMHAGECRVPSARESERKEYEQVQRPAQPGTRKEYDEARPTGNGVEVPPPATPEFGGPVPKAPGRLLAIARNVQTRFPDRDPKFFDPLFGAERARSFQGASSFAAEPDRRTFVRSTPIYLDQEQSQANDESMPSAV